MIFSSGKEDDVLDAKDRLLNMEDEFLQDVEHRAEDHPSPAPKYTQHNGNHEGPGATGFVVKGGPWERDQKPPDTASVADFPSFRGSGSNSQEVSGNVPWGPRR